MKPFAFGDAYCRLLSITFAASAVDEQDTPHAVAGKISHLVHSEPLVDGVVKLGGFRDIADCGASPNPGAADADRERVRKVLCTLIAQELAIPARI
jgi:hypothetical protein